MKNQRTKFKDSPLNTLLRKTFERTKMVSFRNTKVFLTFLQTLSWRVVILATLESKRGARNRVRMIHNFGRYLVLLNKKHGCDFVIAYLKASQLALSKYLAQQPLNSLMEVNPDYIFPRLAHGLPKIIGPRDRVSLRHNNRKTVILWMSIFGIFRVLAGTYKLKLSTIVDPFSGSWSSLEEKSITFRHMSKKLFGALPWKDRRSWKGVDALSPVQYLPLQTSSPSSKVSFKGAIVDLMCLVSNGLDTHLEEWFSIVGGTLGKYFSMFKKSILPEIPNNYITRGGRVLYYRVMGEPIEMARLVRLKSENRDFSQSSLECISPLSTLNRVVTEVFDPEVMKKFTTTEGFGYPQWDPNEVWVIKSTFMVHSGETHCVSMDHVSVDWLRTVTPLFITSAVTQAELASSEHLTDTLLSMTKSDWAVGNSGQLQFVQEPAGKLRVFAMVDCWTQSIMQPIHKLLTSILKSLPNDGTSNQTLSYERARQKSIAAGCSYGYDLSAATDRLPIAIQVSILAGLFESIGINLKDSLRLASLWRDILTKRSFYVPTPPKGTVVPEGTPSHVSYEVGQPMGALSSFNMLAITHHLIMQYVAQSVGFVKGNTWCDAYEITGDDIVIFDPLLASNYVETMESLGLEINQKKSVVSTQKACGEYLKKTWLRNIDVSMISWKQLYQNHSTLMGRVTDALYFCSKWSSANIPIASLVRKAALTWKDLSDPSMKVLNIPFLALLSVALRQGNVKIETFLTFLLKEGEELSFKSLFQKVGNLNPNLAEVQEVLRSFFSGVGVLLPTTPSFLRRTWSLQAGPLMSIHRKLVNQIMTVQYRLHGEFAFHDYNPDSPLDRDWSFSQPEDDFFGGFMSEQGSPLFRGEWSHARLIEISRSIAGARFLKQQGTNVLCCFVEEAMLLPRWNAYVAQVQKVIPDYSTLTYLFDRKQLRELGVSDLITILDCLIGLETFLTIGSVEDKEQRKAHKVNLRVLSSLKPGKDGTPTEDKVHSFWKRVIFVFDEGPSGW